jgi:L,D-peptidoglycan transpeptidase YkuD (ErfK/YbiS/YcfS/YnhG family)
MRRILSAALATVCTFAALVMLAERAQAATVHRQVVTVEAATATSTTAKVTLWQLNAKGVYAKVFGPIGAFVGELGVGKTRDNVARTPAGVFGLTQAFGNQPNNGTKLPYFRANRADWWNGEVPSPAYNTHVHQANSPGPGSENLYTAGFVYSHAVVIDYNRFPVVKGAGGAFFLHVANGQPTAGCVSIGHLNLDHVMRWLDPRQHPMISIGVGTRATAIIRASHNPRGVVDLARPAAQALFGSRAGRSTQTRCLPSCGSTSTSTSTC